MKSFSERFTDAYNAAVIFLDQITTSSRFGALPDRATLSFLRATVQSGNAKYRLYRGLALGRQAHAAEVGQPCPDELLYPLGAQLVMHTTADINVARKYASGMGNGVLIELNVRSSEVMFDYRGAERCFPDLKEEDKAYFRDTKEVLLFKDAKIESSRIIEVNIP